MLYTFVTLHLPTFFFSIYRIGMFIHMPAVIASGFEVTHVRLAQQTFLLTFFTKIRIFADLAAVYREETSLALFKRNLRKFNSIIFNHFVRVRVYVYFQKIHRHSRIQHDFPAKFD